jgi:hypothetical protein
MARARFHPVFDPHCQDAALTEASHDIVIGRWQGLRDLLRTTGPDWLARGHRVRQLAEACAGGSTVESWLAAEPHSGDGLVLRAATETARAFAVAVAAGRGAPIDDRRIDAAVAACLEATEAYLDDPTPWVSLISLARLYPKGVPRPQLEHWWDELHHRDPYSVEGHLQVLHYYSARWHGSNDLMYDFAHDAAGVAPAGSALPVLLQYARVEEYRHALDTGQGGRPALDLARHWDNEDAVDAVRATWQGWLTARTREGIAPGELRDLNHLAHAACRAGEREIASALLRLMGPRATPTPWSYTGDPEQQIVKWRKELKVRD